MKIKPVSEVLALAGMQAPTISALVPSIDNYTTLLVQPAGHIEASATGVRHRNRVVAQEQFSTFLAKARESQADLVVTPEYSMPWDVLAAVLREGHGPEPGKLWVLGCESIKLAELNTLKQQLTEVALVLYEALQPAGTRFLDPLAYVFLAPPIQGNGPSRIVVLVQFKTQPQGDNEHFEVNYLQCGTRVYEFGGTAQTIRLVSLICSDAFAFLDAQAQKVYDRALIIHIQLNPKPRHEHYRLYRDRLLRFKGDATELVCLNWAGNVCEWSGGQEKPWKNIAASAWYLKPDGFDDCDDTLCANHRRGLYYTWLHVHRVHVLFLNFKPAVYFLLATKVIHIGVDAALSRRRGPQLTNTFIWNDAGKSWDEQEIAEDGFAAFIPETQSAKDNIEKLSKENPIALERTLALCAGKIGSEETWHSVRQLDSCVIDASEIIHRMTFCQDPDEDASAFRVARLKRCGRLWDIATVKANLPPALADLANGFRLEWSPDFPHHNAVSNNGQRATLIYMGEDAGSDHINAVAKRVTDYLFRAYADPEENLRARQRVAVWFRDVAGNTAIFDIHRFVKIDKTADRSEFDIGRER